MEPANHSEPFDAARRALRDRFGRTPELAVRAPGRVNLIGEHTDYNEGWVLPCAVDRAVWAVAAPAAHGRFRIHSRELGAEAAFGADALQRGRGWLDYVQGVVAAFRSEGLAVPGLDLALASDLPREAGLSSSAALEVAVATLLAAAAGLELDAGERARLAQRAESEFVGVPCGRMDQLASACGRRDHLLRIDCRGFTVAPVAFPFHAARLLVADSQVRRALAAGAFERRRAECAEAFARAREAGVLPAGARSWRDVGPERLADLERVLAAPWLGRARHVVRENARVAATCDALGAGDLPAVGALLREGMASLRDDFEVSCPELDALCESADATPGCYGSRLTGAGFGGCTVHLVAPQRTEAVAEAIRAGFAARFGRVPPVHAVRPADGAEVVAP